MTQTNNQKKGFDTSHWWNVFNRLFVSWGLLLFLLVAPVCWAFLPFAYRHIKKTDALIEANPFFLVFARMGVSLLLMGGLVVVFTIVLITFRFLPSIKKFGDDCWEAKKGICSVWHSRKKWLLLLAIFYTLARSVEMVCILGYSPWGKELKKTIENVQFSVDTAKASLGISLDKTQKNLGKAQKFLDTAQTSLNSVQTSIYTAKVAFESSLFNNARDSLGTARKSLGALRDSLGTAQSSLDAIQDYGYFMGLILALPLTIVACFIWRKFRSHSKDNDTVNRINNYGLCGKAITLSFVAFGICVGFLTFTSGFLYICSKEPCHVWNIDIIFMTLIACLVAFLTNLAAGCKSMGKLIDEKQGVPTFASILLSSIGINFVMSVLTMLIAFCGAIIHLGIQQKGVAGIGATIKELFCLYWNGKGFVWALWVVVGLCASVIAPIAQLIGVSWHDKAKSDLARYGVSGSDWLVICGGFEPLFVALLMWISVGCLGEIEAFKLCWDHESVMNSYFLIFMAVFTVVVIAIVKIAEVWGDKNTAIRDAMFRQVRGSSIESHKGESENMLYDRAIKLSLLKLYIKREELVQQKVFVTPRVEDEGEKLPTISDLNAMLENLKLPEKVKLPVEEDKKAEEKKEEEEKTVYIVNMVNGNDYFTTDDPFTADVIKTYETYCEAMSVGVSSMSLKRFVKKYTKVSDNEWTDIKKLAQSLDKSVISYNTNNSMPFVLFAPNDESAAEYVRAWNELLDIISDSITNQKIVGQVNRMICDFEPNTKIKKQI